MNIYSYLILITLILSTILSLVSEILNLKNLKNDLPSDFKDIYTKEDYNKSQQYTKDKTQFGLIVEITDLLIFILFWFSGGFNLIDNFARSFGFSEIFTGIIFFGIIFVGKYFLDLPASIYSIFVIEEKFGFNKMTVKTYILDILKSALLSLLIGIPIIYLVLFFFLSLGNLAWIYAWGSTILISLIISYIAPTYIMPLFNKFTPIEDGELKDMIFNFAQKVNYPLKKIYIMDGSKRSTKSNAYFTGFGNNKRIVLFDTLIANHTNEELLSILAHEIGHNKRKHILKNMLISILQSGIVFYLIGLFLNNRDLHSAFFMEKVSVYTSLIFFAMIYSPISEITSILFSILSRKFEFEADEFAVKNSGLFEEFISALKKLSKDNLSNLTPHPLYVFLNYSHPPVLDRINKIKELAINDIK